MEDNITGATSTDNPKVSIPRRGRPPKKRRKTVLPSATDISKEGACLVEDDLDLTQETMDKLYELEADKIDEQLLANLMKMPPSKIAEDVFMSDSQTGMLHLALCIGDNINQTLAQLVALYANERRIPFYLGALYVQAYIKSGLPLFYVRKTADGYERIPWAPNSKLAGYESVMPPPKKSTVQAMLDESQVKRTAVDIPVCPHCGSRMVITCCDIANNLFWAKCTQEARTCELTDGLMPPATFEKAVENFKEYCSSFEDDPPFETDPAVCAVNTKFERSAFESLTKEAATDAEKT